MKKAWKARPHDLAEVVKFGPEAIELHATSDDLMKTIDGQHDLPLIVHFPEYDGENLMDPASSDEEKRIAAEAFYQRCLSKTREWGRSFRGTPKAIIHPGGWSPEPLAAWNRKALYDQFAKTMRGLNVSGVELMVENMPPHPWFYGGQWSCNIFLDPSDCVAYCTGNDWSFCFDVCHAYLWCQSVKDRVTILQFAERVRPIVGHLHVSDAKGVDGEGIQIGEGDMPLAELMKRLAPLNVAASLEVWKGHQDGFAGFKEGWKRLDALMAAPVA